MSFKVYKQHACIHKIHCCGSSPAAAGVSVFAILEYGISGLLEDAEAVPTHVLDSTLGATVPVL